MLLTLDSIQSTSEKAGNFLDQLQWVGENQDQVRRILQRTEEGLTSFNTAMQDFDSLVGDQQLRDDLRKTMADLSRSATELSDVMGEAKATFGELRKTAEGFQQVSEKAEQQLENLNGFTEPLRDNGEQIVNSINSSLRNLDELLAQVVYLTRAINNREGTLGKLVYETEVYDQINRAVGNVEGITRQLKPIVSDVRVFTDKIARDPRQLGARGLLERKPTGLKSGLPGGSAVPPGSTPWH